MNMFSIFQSLPDGVPRPSSFPSPEEVREQAPQHADNYLRIIIHCGKSWNDKRRRYGSDGPRSPVVRRKRD
jgi:hypothetical protein